METSNFIPFRAARPTEVVKAEMEARGMSQKELAELLDMRASNLSRFLRHGDITILMARRLEAAFGIPAESWLRMQLTYERDARAIAAREATARQTAKAAAPQSAAQ